MSTHIATLKAYEIKPELGGGFRGVVHFHSDDRKEMLKSDVLPTLDAARNWAKLTAHDQMAGRFYQLAYLRRRGSYQSNVWA